MPELKYLLTVFLLIFSIFINYSKYKYQTLYAQPVNTLTVDSTEPKQLVKVDTILPIIIDEMEIDPNLNSDEKARVMEILSKQYLMGQFDPAKDKRFSKIPKECLLTATQTIYLRTEALEKFIEMQKAAKKEHIDLKILSATRPFDIQKIIWEKKWLGQQTVNGAVLPDSIKDMNRALKILEWSSLPGTSRHHWGTDIDLNDVDTPYWNKPKGIEVYNWLQKNASNYGFCQVYSPMGEDRPNGYREEKWHWSYIPIARDLIKVYREQIKNKDINGFLGSENAEIINVIEKYVLGINPACD